MQGSSAWPELNDSIDVVATAAFENADSPTRSSLAVDRNRVKVNSPELCADTCQKQCSKYTGSEKYHSRHPLAGNVRQPVDEKGYAAALLRRKPFADV